MVFAVIKKFGDDRAGSFAALIAYYGFLAVFPLLLLITTILGFAIHRNSELRAAVLRSALREFPIVGPQLGEAIRPLQGNALALTIGLIGLVWGALGVSQAAQLAMAEVWNIRGVDRPPFTIRLFRGVGLLVVLGLGLAATTAVATVATIAGESVGVKVVSGAVSAVLSVGLFVLAFRVLTVRAVATRSLLPGAVLAGAAWSILQVVGVYLIAYQLRHASQVYGYFASVLGLVSWMFLGAQLTLYAAEANVVLDRKLWPRSILQPPLTDADRRAFDDIALQGERRPEQSVASTWEATGPPAVSSDSDKATSREPPA